MMMRLPKCVLCVIAISALGDAQLVRKLGSLSDRFKPPCGDDASFKDPYDFRCVDWTPQSCSASNDGGWYSYTPSQMTSVRQNCRKSCGSCPAATTTCQDDKNFKDFFRYDCASWMGHSCSAVGGGSMYTSLHVNLQKKVIKDVNQNCPWSCCTCPEPPQETQTTPQVTPPHCQDCSTCLLAELREAFLKHCPNAGKRAARDALVKSLLSTLPDLFSDPKTLFSALTDSAMDGAVNAAKDVITNTCVECINIIIDVLKSTRCKQCYVRSLKFSAHVLDLVFYEESFCEQAASSITSTPAVQGPAAQCPYNATTASTESCGDCAVRHFKAGALCDCASVGWEAAQSVLTTAFARSFSNLETSSNLNVMASTITQSITSSLIQEAKGRCRDCTQSIVKRLSYAQCDMCGYAGSQALYLAAQAMNEYVGSQGNCDQLVDNIVYGMRRVFSSIFSLNVPPEMADSLTNKPQQAKSMMQTSLAAAFGAGVGTIFVSGIYRGGANILSPSTGGRRLESETPSAMVPRRTSSRLEVRYEVKIPNHVGQMSTIAPPLSETAMLLKAVDNSALATAIQKEAGKFGHNGVIITVADITTEQDLSTSSTTLTLASTSAGELSQSTKTRTTTSKKTSEPSLDSTSLTSSSSQAIATSTSTTTPSPVSSSTVAAPQSTKPPRTTTSSKTSGPGSDLHTVPSLGMHAIASVGVLVVCCISNY